MKTQRKPTLFTRWELPKVSCDYDSVTSADRHKIHARGGKSGKLSDGARARPCSVVGRHFCEGCHSTVADGFGMYFAIYPKDNFSCLRTCLRTFQEHLRLKSSEYLRTFSLSPKIKRSCIKKGVYIENNITSVRIRYCRNFVYSKLSFSISFSVKFYQKLRTRRSLTTTRILRALQEYIRPLKTQSEREKNAFAIY